MLCLRSEEETNPWQWQSPPAWQLYFPQSSEQQALPPVPWWRNLKVRAVKGQAGEVLGPGVSSRSCWAFYTQKTCPFGAVTWGPGRRGRKQLFYWFSEIFWICAKGDSPQHTRFRNLGGEKSRVLRQQLQSKELDCVESRLTQCSQAWHTTVLMLSNQKNELCNHILIICKVDTAIAYLLRMWQRIMNWNDHKALSQVYKSAMENKYKNKYRFACPFPRKFIFVDSEKTSSLNENFGTMGWQARHVVKFTYTLLQSCRLKRLAETCLVTAIYFQLNVPIEYITFFSFMWKFCPDFNSLWPVGHFSPSGFNSVCLWLIPWCSSPFLLSLAECATKCKCFLVCLLI